MLTVFVLNDLFALLFLCI